MSTGEDRPPGQPPSVFVAPDQREMIARLDAVTDDDLESAFFSTSVQEAEDAAVRMFDVGIRTLADERDPGSMAPFPGLPAVPRERQPSDTQPDPRVGAPPRGLDFDDPLVREAFVLGGPAALTREG